MRSISSVLILASCLSVYTQVTEEVVAKVNGKPIYSSEVEKMKEAIKHEELNLGVRVSSDDLSSIALDKIIEERLIIQEAEKEKIKVFDWEVKQEIDNLKNRLALSEGIPNPSPQKVDSLFNEKLKNQGITIEELKNKIRNKIMMGKLVEQKVKSKVKNPTEQEIRRFFDDIVKIMSSTGSLDSLSQEDLGFYLTISERFKEVFGERVRYRHILIKPSSYTEVDKKTALQKAHSIKQRILAGEDFEDVAAKESADLESAKFGGNMGYVFRGSLPESLENVVFSLNPGEISDPVWTDFGYHIIQVVEKKIAEKPKFELVKKDLENLLFQKRYSQAIENYINELKKSAVIEIYKK